MQQKVPWWFTAIAILTALTALRIPWVWGPREGEERVLLLFYPFITILAAFIARRCYAIDRRPMAWILIVVAWLTTLAVPYIM